MRYIKSIVIPLIAAGVLLLPSTSSAASTPCIESCLTRSQVVKVTLLPEGLEPTRATIRQQALPKRVKQYNRIVREYLEELHETTSTLCLETKGAHEANPAATSQIGFSTQLIKFKTVQQLLNRLLNRYGRGFAPSIEDFSGVDRIFYLSGIEENGGGTEFCKFELV